MMEVTFRSLNRSSHIWTAKFDMGSDEENASKALDVAFKHNAQIIGNEAFVPSPLCTCKTNQEPGQSHDFDCPSYDASGSGGT